MSKRYINLSDRQVKDTHNQSQDFMSINTICRRLNQQENRIAELEEFLHNREKWLVEREKQVNFSRAMERVALKGLKELEDRWQKLKEWLMYTLKEKQSSPKYYKFNNVLDKMQELDNGE